MERGGVAAAKYRIRKASGLKIGAARLYEFDRSGLLHRNTLFLEPFGSASMEWNADVERHHLRRQ